jgi:hypothetical protein
VKSQVVALYVSESCCITPAPIPGGCNMEFEVEMAPWLRVSHDSNIISVEHQLAAKPNRNGRPHSCETQSQALHYEVFHWYMTERDFSEESYFNAIRQLRTPQDARENGREVCFFSQTFSKRKRKQKTLRADSDVWFHAHNPLAVQLVPGRRPRVCGDRHVHR